ncbi:MAG: 1-acyl-sn-glycerol-3-phosphate acyltransferase [Hyphomicrobiaceae bacterium]|nr:1-acyl-sn-glycerol-3-phosphate acyltransferase [Hyphomicrobiaceae bacterium]
MVAVRSLIYMVAFYIVTALYLLLGSWLLFAPRSWAMAGLRAHANTCVWLLRWIAGTRMDVRGREHLPAGACLVAAKHQSAWDTFALVPVFRDPALVMKAELMKIPLYGWFSTKFGMIPVRREAGPSALREMLKEARERAADGREILVFPEGTRRIPGAPPDYKPGVLMLYDQLGLPCVPVALNSGLFWPRRSFLRYPGTIVVEILPPIPAGLKRRDFGEKLEGAIETASARLYAEALASPIPPPKPNFNQT